MIEWRLTLPHGRVYRKPSRSETVAQQSGGRVGRVGRVFASAIHACARVRMHGTYLHNPPVPPNPPMPLLHKALRTGGLCKHPPVMGIDPPVNGQITSGDK